MIRMNRIQADLSDPFFGIEGEGHETDDVVVDQGNMDLLWRLRLAQARQMLGLLGIGRSQWADTGSPTMSLKDRNTGSKAAARIRWIAFRSAASKALMQTFVAMDAAEDAPEDAPQGRPAVTLGRRRLARSGGNVRS